MLPEYLKHPLRRLFLQLRALVTDPEVFSPHGIPIRIPRSIDIFLQFRLARGIPHEAPEARMVSQFIQYGTNVLELGGSVGIVSATIRRAIGPYAFHLIVEANADLIETCRFNASIGAQPRTVDVLNAAVDYSGTAMIRFCSSSDALSGHLATQDESGRTVSVTTLRQVAAQMPPKPFALVCDIEGAEFDLFVNEADSLDAVNLIILETHPTRHCDGPKAVARIYQVLEAAGFERVDEEQDVVAFRRVPV